MPHRAVFLERGLDSSNGLSFIRERLALVGQTLFLISFGFYLFLLASMVLMGGAPFLAVVTRTVMTGQLAASWTMGLFWLLATRARLSVPTHARRVAEVLRSQEGRELRIGPRLMPIG